MGLYFNMIIAKKPPSWHKTEFSKPGTRRPAHLVSNNYFHSAKVCVCMCIRIPVHQLVGPSTFKMIFSFSIPQIHS